MNDLHWHFPFWLWPFWLRPTRGAELLTSFLRVLTANARGNNLLLLDAPGLASKPGSSTKIDDHSLLISLLL